jgi:hypothetical protein
MHPGPASWPGTLFTSIAVTVRPDRTMKSTFLPRSRQ